MPVLISVSYSMNTSSIPTPCFPLPLGGILVFIRPSIVLRGTYTVCMHLTGERVWRVVNKSASTLRWTILKRQLFENTLQTGGTNCFRANEKHFQNGAFRKRWRQDNDVISFTESSSNTNSKGPVRAWLLRFQIPPAWCGPPECYESYVTITPLRVSCRVENAAQSGDGGAGGRSVLIWTKMIHDWWSLDGVCFCFLFLVFSFLFNFFILQA